MVSLGSPYQGELGAQRCQMLLLQMIPLRNSYQDSWAYRGLMVLKISFGNPNQNEDGVLQRPDVEILYVSLWES